MREESKVKGSRAEAKEICVPDQAGDDRRGKIFQSLRSFEMTGEEMIRNDRGALRNDGGGHDSK